MLQNKKEPCWPELANSRIASLLSSICQLSNRFHCRDPPALWDERHLIQHMCLPCSCFVAFCNASALTGGSASSNSCDAMLSQSLTFITHSEYRPATAPSNLAFFTSALFYVCASTKTSSIICALLLHDLGFVIFCNIRLPRSFPTLTFCFSSISGFVPCFSQ